MADEAQIHPQSLISIPCEHINISPEKLYQLFLLLRRQLSSDLKKLKQAGAIKEVFYLEWLANTVVVKKKNGK